MEGTELVVASPSGFPCFRNIETAGVSYERWLEKQHLGTPDENNESDSESDSQDDGPSSSSSSGRAKGPRLPKGKKRQGGGKIEKIDADLYEVLGIKHLKWRATEKDIRNAYRKAALKHHPDKKSSSSSVETDEEAFKLVQKANDILSDPEKRRAYDSSLPFDDSIPGPDVGETPAEFFDAFGEAFDRFLRWSESSTKVVLGDLDTPIEKVREFYLFWKTFKSSRDYSFLDEYDLNDSSSRDEKRWMMRKNAKIQEKARKEESKKISTLTERAERKDPRIIAYNKKVEAEKKRIQKEKSDAKRAQAAEAQRLFDEAERLRIEEENKLKELQLQKKREAVELLKTQKLRFKELCAAERVKNEKRKMHPGFWYPLEDDVENITKIITDVDVITAIVDAFSLDDNQETVLKLYYQQLSKVKGITLLPPSRAAAPAPKKSVSAPVSVAAPESSQPWTMEELALLARALVKYPAGIPNRYQLISTMLGTNRTSQEVIKKTKQTRDSSFRPPGDVAESAFEAFTKTKKGKDKTNYKPQDGIISEREEFATITSSSSSAAPVAVPTPVVAATPVATPVAAPEPTKTQAPATPPAAAPAAAASTTGTVPAEDPSSWSAEEQKLLERALAANPAGPADRWDKISLLVPGRSKRDCIARYKYVVELIKKKKAESTA